MYKPTGADFMIIPQKVLEKINNIYFLQTKKRKRISFFILALISIYFCAFRPPYTEYIVPFIFVFLILFFTKYSIIAFFIYNILLKIFQQFV